MRPRLGRKPRGHARSSVHFALDLERASVLLHDRAGRGEPETGAGEILAGSVAPAKEAARDEGNLSGRNPDSLVAHLDADLLGVDFQPELDDASARRELDGVVEDVAEGL